MHPDNEKLKYVPLKDEELKRELQMFESEIAAFFKESGYPYDVQYHVSLRALIDMIDRTDKRKAYYYCFHGMKINECKVAALYAYWILKYRPITLTDDRYVLDECALCINESFAIYVIYATLYRVHGIVQTYDGDNSYYEKLLYSFRFRNISIDAMILLVESIGEDTLNLKYEDPL